MNLAARHSTKKRSHGRDSLACEYFVVDRDLKSSRQLTQNPQHFLFTCDFATFRNIAIRDGRFGNVSSLKGGGR